jgi:hypothetical protein
MRRNAIILVLGGLLTACSAAPAKESLFDDSLGGPGTPASPGKPGEAKPASANVDACTSGESFCAAKDSAVGYCADFATSSANCGGCGIKCGEGSACSDGTCCAEGKTSCGGACTDMKSDAQNCGACGSACGAGQVCWDGACSDACPKGTKTSKGCEVSYDVFDGADLIGTPAKCGDGQIYNNCDTKPIAFKWKDEGPSTPKSMRVSFESGIFCAADGGNSPDIEQTVSVDNQFVGIFSGPSGACTCNAKSQMYSYEVPAALLEKLKSSRTHTVEITGKNTCIGFKKSDRFNGAVARISTTY